MPWAAAAVSGALAAGCAAPDATQNSGSSAPVEMAHGRATPGQVPKSLIREAVRDAAQRSNLTPYEIVLVSAAAVTWPDGALGCPRPDVMYTQALVPGYRIVLQAGEQLLNYHAGSRGSPRYCPAENAAPSFVGSSSDAT
jgi:hypothetical protein